LKIAYVIAAHRRLDQLERLMRRLDDADTTFVVHVDLRAGKEPYEELLRQTADLANVHYVDRHLGHWGGFGVLRAALKSIRYLVDEQVPFEYAALLSGQDYPLRPPDAVRRSLAGAKGASFMAHHALPFPGWGKRGGLDRVEDFHVIGRIVLHLRLPRKRRIPGGLVPFGGSRTWFLHRELIEHVDTYVRRNPAYVRFFEHALSPEEMFFQTLILNSEHAGSIVNDHRLYLEWRGGSSPATFTLDDFDRIIASDALFARKFDVGVDSDVLDALDAHIDSSHDAARA
jgi:Core-2/I-Branching enzyme